MMYIFLIVSFLFDGILTNYFPFFQESLSLFTPYLSIVAVFLVFPFFRKGEEKKYFITIMLYGFFYDLFYTNLWMCHVLLYWILAFLTIKIWKNIQVNYFTLPFLLTFLIGFYHFLFFLLLLCFNVILPTTDAFFYLWGHSLLFNLLIGEILYFLFQHFHKKYHRMSLS